MSTHRTYPILGIKPPRPLRYEIRQFTNPKFNKYAKTQLNMFLLALVMIQAMSREERLSWFQICGMWGYSFTWYAKVASTLILSSGIHGMPYVTWDGSKGSTDPGEWGGYCTHASILFPTWHRLYVALIEVSNSFSLS
jgi:tyrosinase